jgi:RHS repeat-associated protein
VSYRYDAQERRVRQDSGGQTTIWVYDAFGQLAAEYATNLTMVLGVYYRTTDHLGSTRIVTNQSAAVVQRRDFFPFGEAIPADSSHGNRHLVLDGGQATYNTNTGVKQQFTGQQRDAETGLDYFWARNYVPALGRFSSIDPASGSVVLGDPQSWNRYSYVKNAPYRFIDPRGETPILVIILGAAAAGAAFDIYAQFIEGDDFDLSRTIVVSTASGLGGLVASVFAASTGLAGAAYTTVVIGGSVGGNLAANAIIQEQLGPGFELTTGSLWLSATGPAAEKYLSLGTYFNGVLDSENALAFLSQFHAADFVATTASVAFNDKNQAWDNLLRADQQMDAYLHGHIPALPGLESSVQAYGSAGWFGGTELYYGYGISEVSYPIGDTPLVYSDIYYY